jgi:hypothetical protein
MFNWHGRGMVFRRVHFSRSHWCFITLLRPGTGALRRRLPRLHQVGKTAVRTDRVRVFAKVPDDLHQALLRCRAGQDPRMGSSQQTLPRQFQDRIVRRRRPREKPPFNLALEFFIAAFLRADPQPRQNHVHGQVRDPRRAEQRLRPGQPRRLERPVP